MDVRVGRCCFCLFGLLYVALVTSALSLADFQTIATNQITVRCFLVYDACLVGCTLNDFQKGQCSTECQRTISNSQRALQIVCHNRGVSSRSVLGRALKGNLIAFLCPASKYSTRPGGLLKTNLSTSLSSTSSSHLAKSTASSSVSSTPTSTATSAPPTLMPNAPIMSDSSAHRTTSLFSLQLPCPTHSESPGSVPQQISTHPASAAEAKPKSSLDLSDGRGKGDPYTYPQSSGPGRPAELWTVVVATWLLSSILVVLFIW